MIGLKRIVAVICVAVAFIVSSAQQTPFPYPEPPEDMMDLTERTTYLVDHFWERAPLKSLILDEEKMTQAFVDYISFMPYAKAENVYASVDALLSSFAKEPDNLLRLARIAEKYLYEEGAPYMSDDVYLPIAKAVVANKKVKKASKVRFERQAKLIEATRIGAVAPDFTFIRQDGTTAKLSDFSGKYILLFINDPGCDDCMMARVRLSADHNLSELIEKGKIDVISIYPDAPDDDWRAAINSYNRRWIVGAAPGIDEIYDMRMTPKFYYLNDRHEILSKTATTQQLLEGFARVNPKTAQK